MNKVVLVGRLTKDPEAKMTSSQVPFVNFTVAVDRRFKDSNGQRQADFINCVAWRQTAEFVSHYFNKVKMIALEGSLRTGKYQDKNHEDVTHYTTEVYVDNVEFVGGKGDGGQQTQDTPKQNETPTAPAEPVDSASSEDCPF